MDAMIVVLWAVMFLCTFLAAVLARRDLVRAALALYWVTVLWAAAAPASLGLATWAEVLIPSFLVFIGGAIFGKLVNLVRRALRPTPPDAATPATGTPQRQD